MTKGIISAWLLKTNKIKDPQMDCKLYFVLFGNIKKTLLVNLILKLIDFYYGILCLMESV